MYQKLGNTDILLYDFLNTASVILLLLFNLTQIYQKKAFLSNISLHIIQKSKNKKREHLFRKVIFWAIVETVIFSLCQSLPVLSLNKAFAKLVGTGTNYFGLCFFLPIILMASFYIFSVNPLKQLDLITPGFPLTLITIKLACFCHGCCNGLECSFGLYNHRTGLVEFPIQLVESGLGFIIFLFLMAYRKKAKEGTMFPIYLILYSGTRFFSEFFRTEENIVWNLKTYHILCLTGVIIGIVELIIVKKYGNKIVAFYDSSFNIFKNFIKRIALKTGIKKEKNIIHHKSRKKKKKNINK